MVKVTVVNFGANARGFFGSDGLQRLVQPGEPIQCEVNDGMRQLFLSMARNRDPLMAFELTGELPAEAAMICDFLRMHSTLDYAEMLQAFQSIAGTNALTMRPTRPAMLERITELATARFSRMASFVASDDADASEETAKPPRGRPPNDKKPTSQDAKKPKADKTPQSTRLRFNG